VDEVRADAEHVVDVIVDLVLHVQGWCWAREQIQPFEKAVLHAFDRSVLIEPVVPLFIEVETFMPVFPAERDLLAQLLVAACAVAVRRVFALDSGFLFV
jgi:hypothetical protein